MGGSVSKEEFEEQKAAGNESTAMAAVPVIQKSNFSNEEALEEVEELFHKLTKEIERCKEESITLIRHRKSLGVHISSLLEESDRIEAEIRQVYKNMEEKMNSGKEGGMKRMLDEINMELDSLTQDTFPECAVCLEACDPAMGRAAFCCPEGHIVCQSCEWKLKQCPQCRLNKVDFGGRFTRLRLDHNEGKIQISKENLREFTEKTSRLLLRREDLEEQMKLIEKEKQGVLQEKNAAKKELEPKLFNAQNELLKTDQILQSTKLDLEKLLSEMSLLPNNSSVVKSSRPQPEEGKNIFLAKAKSTITVVNQGPKNKTKKNPASNKSQPNQKKAQPNQPSKKAVNSGGACGSASQPHAQQHKNASNSAAARSPRSRSSHGPPRLLSVPNNCGPPFVYGPFGAPGSYPYPGQVVPGSHGASGSNAAAGGNVGTSFCKCPLGCPHGLDSCKICIIEKQQPCLCVTHTVTFQVEVGESIKGDIVFHLLGRTHPCAVMRFFKLSTNKGDNSFNGVIINLVNTNEWIAGGKFKSNSKEFLPAFPAEDKMMDGVSKDIVPVSRYSLAIGEGNDSQLGFFRIMMNSRPTATFRVIGKVVKGQDIVDLIHNQPLTTDKHGRKHLQTRCVVVKCHGQVFTKKNFVLDI